MWNDVKKGLWIAGIVSVPVILLAAIVFLLSRDHYWGAGALTLVLIFLGAWCQFGLPKAVKVVASLVVLAGIVLAGRWCHDNDHATIFWVTLGALAVALVAVVPLFLYWRYYLSIKRVAADFVAIMLFMGKPCVSTPPEPKNIYRSGPAFVPYVPLIRFDGHPIWELALIPRKPLIFRFEKDRKDPSKDLRLRIWSNDGMLLLVEVSGYVRLPYDDAECLVMLLQNEVPFEETALQRWMEEEIVAGVRDAMAAYGYQDAMGRSNLTAINTAMTTHLLRTSGLFVKSGICGRNPNQFDPGTGEVIIRVEEIEVDENLRKQLQAPELARLKALAAKGDAQAQAEIAAVIVQTHATWLQTPAGQSASQEEREKALEIIRQRVLSQDGNYSEQKQVLEVHGLQGIQYLSTGGGGGAGILLGSQGQGRGGNPGGQGQRKRKKGGKKQKPDDMDDDEIDEDVGH